MDYLRACHKTFRGSISSITEMRGPTLRLAQKIPQGLDKAPISPIFSPLRTNWRSRTLDFFMWAYY
jgi:hypothetical protein